MEVEILTDEQRKIKLEFSDILFKHLEAFRKEVAEKLDCKGVIDITGNIDKFGSLWMFHVID